ncbi:CoB--CoM heterodisulfide reductase iron-sulfur subunit A family protein [Candidatus Desantisbacteria bacterium]|nr:CoB--CoM heterodisulfide reductase iron-sulfur subunit A family protein [Candidatus Desantisbacteria bacterium]
MSQDILIIGGGISGITAAVEAAETGYNIILVEKNPYLGGRVVQMNRYFPKLCPPYCGMEINLKRIRTNNRIKHYTMAEVQNITGSEGNYEVTIKINPRFVNQKCTACGECSKVCPAIRTNDFNFGMSTTKAAYLPHELAFPYRFVVDEKTCIKCGACVDACKYEAIDLKMQPETIKLTVASIVTATGWQPYNAEKIDNLGFGKHKDIITNMMMERIAAPNGVNCGKILRPSDQKEPKRVAFVQCAGSRDINHLPYCSAVCCLASLKQITYVRENIPGSEAYMFYIDVRTPGMYEEFYNKVKSDEKVHLIKGKVASVEQDGDGLIVVAEDILSGVKSRVSVDLVVLACGMQPTLKDETLTGIKVDENGFISPDQNKGVYGAGVAKKPQDVSSSVQDATGCSLKAIQSVVRR